jgi:hypothetical protein
MTKRKDKPLVCCFPRDPFKEPWLLEAVLEVTSFMRAGASFLILSLNDSMHLYQEKELAVFCWQE